MKFPHGASVTVIRGGKRNRDGDRVGESRHVVPGCAVAWSSGAAGNPSSSDGGVQDVSRSASPRRRVQIYCAAGADFMEDDRLIFPGVSQQFRVIGYPAEWSWVFSGGGAGMVVSCEEVTSSVQMDA